MTRFTFEHTAPSNVTFAPDAFAGAVGKGTTISGLAGQAIPAKLIDAEVSGDGRSVLLTVETDMRLPQVVTAIGVSRMSLQPMSMGFTTR
jgi:hypothetical protein